MTRIVGVRFKERDKVQYCPTGDLDLKLEDRVVVERERGPQVGRVVTPPKEVVETEPDAPLRPLLRKATQEDMDQRQRMRQKEEQALPIAKNKARELGLEIKLVDAECLLDDSRITFSFAAEERVDFRLLLRALGETLRRRVELRQIGPRDAAKIAGGLGGCGQVLCCTRWMQEFPPVTIRMAKEQALPVSAERLTGKCGRLLCCLRFEYEHYVESNRRLPSIGEWVTTAYGPAKVVVGHPLMETVSVLLEGEALVELPLSQVQRRRRASPRGQGAPEAAGEPVQ